MKPLIISPAAKKLSVRFADKSITLPIDVQAKIDSYWNELMAGGSGYQRGEVFTVVEKEFDKDSLNILVERTDYAHYLYCQNVESLGRNGVHIIHTAALVETSDNYTILGEMGVKTARPGVIQLCGGGIDDDDLKGEYFDFTHNITKELQEELGINISDNERINYFEEAYFKEGGLTDKMTMIYKVILNETRCEFLEKYHLFSNHLLDDGVNPEFDKVIMLKKEKEELKKFFSQEEIFLDEYMKPLFNKIIEELQ